MLPWSKLFLSIAIILDQGQDTGMGALQIRMPFNLHHSVNVKKIDNLGDVCKEKVWLET